MNIKKIIILTALTVHGTHLCMKRAREIYKYPQEITTKMPRRPLTMAQFLNCEIDKKLVKMQHKVKTKPGILQQTLQIPSDVKALIAQHVFLKGQEWWFFCKKLNNSKKHDHIYALSFYQNNKLIVATNNTLQIIDLLKNKTTTLITSEQDIISIALSSDEETLAYGLLDGTIEAIKLNCPDHKLFCVYTLFPVWALAFNQNNTKLACASENKKIYEIETTTQTTIPILNVPSRPYGLTFCHSKETLTYGLFHNILATINTQTSVATILSTKFKELFALASNYNDTKLAIGSKSKQLHVIHKETQSILMSTEFKSEIYSLAFNKQDNLLAIGLNNGSLYSFKHHTHPTTQQLILRKILSLWIQCKKQNKCVCSSDGLLINIANLFNLSHKELSETWKTFPENMQNALWRNMDRLIRKYGK